MHPDRRQDLSNKIQELFHLLDHEGNGTLNYVEMQVPDASHLFRFSWGRNIQH